MARGPTNNTVFRGVPALALDLSGRTGWCGGRLKPKWGVWKLFADKVGDEWKDDPAPILVRLETAIRDAADAMRRANPEGTITLAIEREMPVQHQQANSGSLQISLAAIARVTAFHEDMEIVSLPPTTIRSGVMGPAGAKITAAEKRGGAIVQWLNRRGFEVYDHNAADALLLWLHIQGYRDA